MSGEALVGIIANPASGKDIRRLVAHGSAFDNNEKINIVRRVLLGLDAWPGVRVAYLPDNYGIVERAVAGAKPRLPLSPLPMPIVGHASDSTEAARRLSDLGASVIITLGGDGTNRAVAKGCGDVPLVPISTGTNNVFPRMMEGTLAGIAAALVATEVVGNRPEGPRIIKREPKLEISLDGSVADIALIDAVSATATWIGARALWDPSHLREVVLSRISPAAIGIASLGMALYPALCGQCSGAWITIGTKEAASTTVAVPIAPGLMRQIPVAASGTLAHGASRTLAGGPCTLALDGEREIEIFDSGTRIDVRLVPQGPRVIDVDAAIQLGAEAGAFRR